jgi:hypothetical protein
MKIVFKPEFGNVSHIRIVEMIKEVEKKEKLLEKRMEEYQVLRGLKQEIRTLTEQVENEISKIHGKNN